MTEAICLLWPLSGLAAWLWIVVRNDMIEDFESGVMAVLMTFPAAVAGPLNWLNVWLSERER